MGRSFKDEQAFISACARGRIATLRRLFSRGFPVSWCDAHQRSGLHWAAQEGRLAVVQLLLGLGVDTAIIDCDDATALVIAAGEGRLSIVKALLKGGAEPNGGKHNQALTLAAALGFLPIVRALATAGASLDNCDKGGRTALFFAVIRNHPDVVAFLLKKGARSDLKDTWGKDALYYAKRMKRKTIEKQLMERKLYVERTRQPIGRNLN